MYACRFCLEATPFRRLITPLTAVPCMPDESLLVQTQTHAINDLEDHARCPSTFVERLDVGSCLSNCHGGDENIEEDLKEKESKNELQRYLVCKKSNQVLMKAFNSHINL